MPLSSPPAQTSRQGKVPGNGQAGTHLSLQDIKTHSRFRGNDGAVAGMTGRVSRAARRAGQRHAMQLPARGVSMQTGADSVGIDARHPSPMSPWLVPRSRTTRAGIDARMMARPIKEESRRAKPRGAMVLAKCIAAREAVPVIKKKGMEPGWFAATREQTQGTSNAAIGVWMDRRLCCVRSCH
jgi:hypothetical protein